VPLREVAALVGATIAPQSEPHDHYLTVDGLRLHYLEWGRSDAPPVVLLHSGEETAHSWDLLGQALSDRYRVLALDSRGCGGSQRTSDGRYSQEGFARDAVGLVTALDLSSAVLIGQAYGARHATIVASAEPERTRGLVIVDTSPQVDPEATAEVHAFVRATRSVASYDRFVQLMAERNPMRPLRQTQVMLVHEVRQQGDGSWTWNRDLRSVLSSGSDPSPMSTSEYLWSVLAALTCPTLLVRGALSPFVSAEMAERMHQTIPGSRLETIAAAGHLVAGDNPSAFEQTVRRFLSELPERGTAA
jgi:pimeloyl-ACP methyl ester carboxylesterase